MDLGITGKNALVTGGANGIGQAISIDLAKEGVNIFFTSRDDKTIKKGEILLKKFGIKAKGYKVDFLKKAQFSQFLKKIKKLEIDILINNAGHTFDVKDPYCNISDWRKVMSVNFETPVQIINAVVKSMKRKKWGRIVNITSCAGLENSGPVTYTVSKAALTAYSRTMGRILASESQDIVMSALFPGVVATKGGHWDKILKTNPSHAKKYLSERCPLGRFGRVEEISPVVTFYSSKLVSFSQGAIVPVDGGQSKHFMYHNYLS
ncbi:SDR family oxidoreductase [Candidatus Pelagibacter ubique]|nr:SDR family oxidoreductase [Candidatus Pelagibacter ubique]|tara:strand:- start:940 stop:1728 length:789 start_codon:yes stop_codon:yes gene_type:complete